MKLDDIDRERYTLAMLALGMAYAMVRGARNFSPISDEQTQKLDDMVARLYELNAQASLLEGKPKP